MPLGTLATLGLSFGPQLLQALLGGGKQKTGYKMSPEELEIYKSLMGQYKGDVPSYVTQPIKSEFGALKKGISERTGQSLGAGSGLETAQLMKATASEGRTLGDAVAKYKQMILGQMGGLVGGKGTTTTGMTSDWGGAVGGGMQDMGLLMLLQQILGGQKTGTGGGYTMPASFAKAFSFSR